MESGSKKLSFQPNIVKRYKRYIDYLKVAQGKESLSLFNSLNLEALKEDKSSLFPLRVNHQYRIVFTIYENLEQPVLTI